MISTTCLLEKIKKEFSEVIGKDRITISQKNRKMNNITSFSVLPVLTCPNCENCCVDCYAVKMIKLYKNVGFSYAKNTYLLLTNPKSVYFQLINHCMTVSVFRFNVSGDIFNDTYMNIIDMTAKTCKNTRFLLFTKSYTIVSEYYKTHEKPQNLQIIFSRWKNTIYNPLRFPESDIFEKTDFLKLSKNDFLCGGNCAECFASCEGCFKLKRGQTVYFKKH